MDLTTLLLVEEVLFWKEDLKEERQRRERKVGRSGEGRGDGNFLSGISN